MVFLFWLLMLGENLSIAQIQTDSNAINHESMRQGINTFSSGSGIDFRKNLGGKMRITGNAGQYFIFNRALPSRRFITNNVWTTLGYSKILTKGLIWQNEAGQQSFIANETRLSQVLSALSFGFRPGNLSDVSVRASAGFVNDKRQAYDNSGYKAEIMARLNGLSADSNLHYYAGLLVNQSNPLPRKNSRTMAEAGISRDFFGGGLLAFEGHYLRNQVEDYLGNDIQSISSDTVAGRFRIRIPIFRGMVFSSFNEILTPNRSFFYLNRNSRTELRNVRYFQDEYQSLNTLLYRSKRLQLQGSFESKLRNRTYDILNRLNSTDPLYQQQLNTLNQKLNEERIKDIREQYTTFTMDSRWLLSSIHSLRASYTAQLLRVDTRSEQNNQDRDEVLYAGELAHDWKLPYGLRLSNKFSGNYRHLIFIKASQSSENYTDRILRWEPSLRWTGKKLYWAGSMGIWATYQVRDFTSQQDRNRSNRVLIFSHQIDYHIDGQKGLILELLRRENRLSLFNWQRFSESPIDTVTIHDLAFRFKFGAKSGVSIQAGYRAFWQVRKSRASLIEPGSGAKLIFLKSYFVQQGPQIRIMANGNGRLKLQGELWLQWSSQFFSYKKSDLIYLGNSYSAQQLTNRENRFLPFFNLQATWNLNKAGS